MTAKHLPIGGSTASRTLACPGWINASKDVPKGRSSVYADKGNLLHDAMENFYGKDEGFSDQLARGLTYAEQTLTQDLIDDILIPSQKMVEEVMDTYDVQDYFCEPFVQYIPDLAGGSIDMLGFSANGKIAMVLDYKTGHNPVSPKSPQLPFYALSAMRDPITADFFKKVTTLVYVIVQPKVSHNPQIHEATLKDLLDFEDTINQAIEKTARTDPPRSAGKHCQYCPAAPYCAEKKASVVSAMRIKPEAAESLSTALDLVEQLQTWIKDVEKHAHDMLETGANIPGYKLVTKRATRKWKDTKVADKLKNIPELFDRKLKTPAQAEKVLKKLELAVDLDQYIKKESSGTTVVPEKDKRKAVVIPEIADSLHRIVNDGKQQ